MKACIGLLVLVGIGATAAACEGSSGGGNDKPGTDGGLGVDDGSVSVDGGADAALPSCPARSPNAVPTEHTGTILGSETWTADKSPHVVPSNLGISGTVTIEPCAEVLISAVQSISINATGKLIAEGQPGRPIRIAASDPAKPFAQLSASGGGTMRFAYVDIENGGDPQNTIIDVIGTILAQGSDQTLPTQETVFVDHVTVKGSRSNGINLQDGAGFASGSKELTVTGSKNFPVSLSARAISTVPTGKYTGNTIDEILVPGGGGANAVQEDATMHERGVPYRIGNSLTAGALVVENTAVGGTFSTLTIEPGVTLRFKKGGEVIVETYTSENPAAGALVAVGTAAKPIVFTSAEATPVAGDWVGISFNSVPRSVDKVAFARVDYAGGLTSGGSDTCNTDPVTPDAAIRVRGLPASEFVTNTTIANSAAHGIDRGYRSDTKLDFLATNTFIAVAACQQTYPKDANGGCPAMVPCPK